MTDTTFANRSARSAAGDDPALRESLRADDVERRRAAALAAVDRADDGGLSERELEVLGDTTRSDPDPEVRQFAVEALGVAGAELDATGDALDDPDEWVRAEAVVALSRAAGGEATDRLRDALDDPSGWVRRNAVVALGKLGAVDAERLHDRLANDPHPPVREYAAEYLGTTDEDASESVRLLAAVLAREQNAFVRARAATSLGRFGTERAVEALETQGLTDRSDDVQRAARRALAEARGEDPDAAVDSGVSPNGGRVGPDAHPADPRSGGSGCPSTNRPNGPEEPPGRGSDRYE